MNTARRNGMRFEGLAREYLQDQGLELLRQNFHCRCGEIDLIMNDRGTLCFIEVKFRKSMAFGGAGAAIPLAKQRKLVKTAHYFLAAHRHLHSRPMRFDALLIQGRDGGGNRIEWIQNAFYAQ